MENDVSFCIFHYLYHSIRAKKRHSRLKSPQKVRQKFNAKIVQAAERVCWQLARGIYSKYASAANLLLNFTAEWDMLCLK